MTDQLAAAATAVDLAAAVVTTATGHLARAAAVDERLAGLVEPLLGPMLAPTILRSGEIANVIPGTGELVCSCRLLPGQTSADTRRIHAGSCDTRAIATLSAGNGRNVIAKLGALSASSTPLRS